MKPEEIEKGIRFVLAETVAHVSDSVVSKTLMKKPTGMIGIFSVDSGKALAESTSPFDTFVQVIEGAAEVIIETRATTVEAGQAIIIPAHARRSIAANVRFKILLIVIKSGYEEVII